ncbi:hypothetical protein Vretifemale_12803 [Volvox reticuliferus]|uniref:Uncharacterized protein n=1 Tax=Volvox reticuliferus TaxID=1737510 RepID=A0A8J4FPX5_9CHLO|nr:hypothetical protein Vretifemale_12803 [Volvox reticuliferus]
MAGDDVESFMGGLGFMGSRGGCLGRGGHGNSAAQHSQRKASDREWLVASSGQPRGGFIANASVLGYASEQSPGGRGAFYGVPPPVHSACATCNVLTPNIGH